MERSILRSGRGMIVAASVLLLAVASADADTIHDNQTITTNTTWSAAGNDHIVIGAVTVQSGATLTIAADCVVRFDSAARLRVYGTLNVPGTSGHEVLFTRRDPTDQWQGLFFYGGSTGSLEYCIVEHATYGNGYAVYANECAPSLVHCTLRDNDYGVYGDAAGPSFLNNEITDNLAYGIYLTGASLPTFGSSLAEWNDIHGNGSGNPDRDLRNGTADITAAYVYWGTIVEAQVQGCIHHEPDDSALGFVQCSPWTNAAHDTTYTGTTTAAPDLGPALPQRFSLAQNQPNPFRADTEIRYALPHDTRVRLDVFDITGRRIQTLVDGVEPAGFKTVRWDTRRVGSGVYFYRLQAGEFEETRKMVSLR
jgi:hypothetical protein